MANFTPRLTRPEAGNKYYITKSRGGWSDAIQGSPTDALCNVLSNCVGYAYGRFNEIAGAGCCKYLRPTNAENFIQNSGGLTVGQEPRLGACMVWRKGATLSGSDGAGHVAIVERIDSPTQILTSESGWGSAKTWWNQTRKKGTGNWGMGSAYTFLGFIYQPGEAADGTPSSASGTTATETPAKTPLTADGYWGMATTRRLQEIFGTTVDGMVSNQHLAYRSRNPGLCSGWNWCASPNGKGSDLIRAMQKWAGMATEAQDGQWGPNTCRAVQRKLGTPQDGVVSAPSAMVRALQKWANEQP